MNGDPAPHAAGTEPEPPTAKPSGATKPAGGAGSSARSARRRARELALQGLYAWQLSRAEPSAVAREMRDAEGFSKADAEHFDALLMGCMADAAALDALLAPHLDRRLELLSPVEHGVLWIGTYELQHCLEIPYRVVINEAVELAKSFGGTDGHKFVNGVLDKAAAKLRAIEVAAAPPRRRAG